MDSDHNRFQLARCHQPASPDWLGTTSVATLIAINVLSASCISHTHIESREMMPKVRAVMAAQNAYQTANCGLYASTLACLEAPWNCIPNYPREGPRFIESERTPFSRRLEGSFSLQSGGTLWASEAWDLKLVAGRPPENLPSHCSSGSVVSFAYTATVDGSRAFCGDSAGKIVYSTGRAQDGDLKLVGRDGLCELDGTPKVTRHPWK